MFNIVTFVFEFFCNRQSYSRYIQVWKFLPDYYISTILFFWAFCWQILNWIIPPISWSYFSSLYLSVNHSVHSFSYIFKYMNSTLFLWKKINFHGQHTYSYWKLLMSPHIWFPGHRNRRLWKADSSVHSPGGPAKSGKCCRGNWDSLEGATQWKRAVSKTNVKLDTNNPIEMYLEDNLALRISMPALEIHPKILFLENLFFPFFISPWFNRSQGFAKPSMTYTFSLGPPDQNPADGLAEMNLYFSFFLFFYFPSNTWQTGYLGTWTGLRMNTWRKWHSSAKWL